MSKGTPHRKKMKRPSRLQSAKHLIPTYTGKNIVKGYQKWFGVDLVCAIKELKMLGVKLDEQYVSRALQAMEQRMILKQKQCEQREQRKWTLNYPDSDDNFYYIVGYTSCGFPYGITWQEAEERGLLEDA